MGLSISKQASSTAPKFRKKSMSKMKGGPVLWIDFTDRRTVYSDGSQTLVNHSESKLMDKMVKAMLYLMVFLIG